jgi:hypothetical protein
VFKKAVNTVYIHGFMQELSVKATKMGSGYVNQRMAGKDTFTYCSKEEYCVAEVRA